MVSNLNFQLSLTIVECGIDYTRAYGQANANTAEVVQELGSHQKSLGTHSQNEKAVDQSETMEGRSDASRSTKAAMGAMLPRRTNVQCTLRANVHMLWLSVEIADSAVDIDGRIIMHLE